MEFLEQSFIGNTLDKWMIAVVAIVITVSLLRITQCLVSRKLSKLAARTETHWDDFLVEVTSHTRMLFLLVLGLFFGSLFLTLPENIQKIFNNLLVITLLVQVGIWSSVFIRLLLEQYRKDALEKEPATVTTISVIGFVSKIVLWSIITLLALDNLGVNVTALVAGLGIGGVAVALAVQNILGDLFASLSIMLDKPFVIRDFLIIGDYMGSVEYVGLKTTRIRSLSGEQLVFSNSDLLNSRIRNYGRMFERRVVFTIGVTYETPREKLKRIPDMIRESIESQDETRFDRSHFMKYGDYSLVFETVYYVLTPDYNKYMDIQQAIYFDIHERFEQEHIEFAYPTRKLYITQNMENNP
jgi:small-conductance mechanosensitive channel